MEKNRKAIICLDKNENLYGPADKCYEALASCSISDLSFYDRSLVNDLVLRLTGLYSISRDQVILGYGNEGILKMIYAYFVGSDDFVLLPGYSWWYYEKLSEQRLAKNVFYDIYECGDTYCYDFDSLFYAEKKFKPCLTIICSPNNPTGNSFDVEYLERLLALNKERLVLFDQTYWGFATGSDDKVFELLDFYDNLIVLRGFSKYYALAGIRMGFAFCGKNTKVRFRIYDNILGFSNVIANVAISALESDEYYDSVVLRIRNDRDFLFNVLNRIDNVICYRSDSNFLFVKFLHGVVGDINKLLLDNGLKVKFFDKKPLLNSARISVGISEHVRLVANLIESYFDKIT